LSVDHRSEQGGDTVTDETVACIVLAAGAGSRFSDKSHKLLAALPAVAGRPAESVAARAIARAVDARIGQVIVVTGRLSADELEIVTSPEVIAVHNSRWTDGQMTSVHVGIDVARALGASIVVIGLADQPGVTAEAWRAVASAASGGAEIAVATYDGRRANPVALRSGVWGLLATDGDEGARSLMRQRDDLVVPVSCSGSPIDIDTVEDLHTWQNS
jgi:molybdenum cofactor cytidylyltransferase